MSFLNRKTAFLGGVVVLALLLGFFALSELQGDFQYGIHWIGAEFVINNASDQMLMYGKVKTDYPIEENYQAGLAISKRVFQFQTLKGEL